MNALRKRGIVPPEIEWLYRDLRSLRNRAAHELAFEPSREAVLSFIKLSKELENAVRALTAAA